MKILIIEDDTALNDGLQFAFLLEGHQVLSATTVSETYRIFSDVKDIDIIILDCNLPDGDGFEVCKKIRTNSQVPIIMLTARDMEIDEIKGLVVGADDYITKPCTLAVLKAHVNALMRRHNYKKSLISNSIRINVDEHKVFKNDFEVCLSNTEFKLLHYLIVNKGQLLLKDMIWQYLWGVEFKEVEDSALSVNIRRLRMKIEDDPSDPKWIKTVYGMGYMWEEIN